MKISAKQYARLILETVEKTENDEEASKLIEKIGGLIKKNKNERKLFQILDEVDKLEKESGKFVEVFIQSSGEISDETIKKIRGKVAVKKEVLLDKVKISSEIRSELKGGLVVKIGNKVIDGCVKTKLECLKKDLVS